MANPSLDDRALARIRDRGYFPAEFPDEAIKRTWVFAAARLDLAFGDLGRAYMAQAYRIVDAFKGIGRDKFGTHE